MRLTQMRSLSATDSTGQASADPDESLVRLAQAGATEPFEELVKRHEKPLFGYLYHMAGSRAIAEDLTQTTLIRAWEKLETFRYQSRFKTWLFRIAHHLCVNYVTRTKTAAQIPLNAAAEPATEPAEAMRRKRQTGLVQAALAQLPANQRACLVLAVYEEMDYRQIAEATGRTVRAVDSLLVRARRNLRQMLQAQENDALRVC